MARLSKKGYSKSPAFKEKMHAVMREHKRGELKSYPTGKPVTSRRQAVAIALSSARRETLGKKKSARRKVRK